MIEIIFFILGLVLGGLIGVIYMSMLQINRVNEMECEYRALVNRYDGGKNGKEKND